METESLQPVFIIYSGQGKSHVFTSSNQMKSGIFTAEAL
jgi:hypothetical protein